MSSGIKVTFKGFEEMLENIKAAGGDVNKAVDSAMKQSAQIVKKELKLQMSKADFKSHKGVDKGLISRMPEPSVEWEGNKCSAKVGYEKGTYNPHDISDAYKAIFLNFGTPKISPTRYIAKAKKKAMPQVKKEQKKALEKITERLK